MLWRVARLRSERRQMRQLRRSGTYPTGHGFFESWHHGKGCGPGAAVIPDGSGMAGQGEEVGGGAGESIGGLILTGSPART